MAKILKFVVFITAVADVTTEDKMNPIFNAMTPYFWVKDVNEAISSNENGSIMYGGHSCHIKALNILFRHSARYPSLQWINKMNDLHQMLKKKQSVLDKHPFIPDWINPFPEEKEYSQSAIGDDEMLKLGKRFGKRFIGLFRQHFREIDYAVTSKTRTQSSQSKFFDGISKLPELQTQSGISSSSVMYSDILLRFYEHCKKYINDIDNDQSSKSEFYKFLSGSEMEAVTAKANQKLGTHNITAEDVVTIQQICAFELGMFQISDWCQFLDMEDLQTIDYLIDLRNYYEMGYGHDINWQVSCPFTSKMFTRLDTAVEEYKRAQIDISFGHTDTILPLYTAFGLFKDSVRLQADNFDILKNRKFRTSLIGPFSANFGVGLYKCDISNEYVVRLFVNEETVIIPACNQTTCTYAEFKTFYSNLADCNFEKICDESTSSAASLKVLEVVPLICFLVLMFI